MTTPRKLFAPPLSLGKFLDHALAIAIDQAEASEVRVGAMNALSVHLIEPAATPTPPAVASPPRVAGPSPAVGVAAIVGLAVGVLVGLVLA